MDTSQLYTEDPNTRKTRRRNREIEISSYPRDLLHTFLTDPNQKQKEKEKSVEEEEEEEEEIEFNLGLSLGGRFGVDKPHRGLIRSSSIAGDMVIPRLEEKVGLERAASLPAVTEEEWRRRKATLRRMEAKRRRFEKQRSAGEGNPVHGSPGSDRVLGKGGSFFRSLQGLLAHQQIHGGSPGSVESYGGGGGSSGASEAEVCKTYQQGSGSCGGAKSPASTQSLQMQERGSQEGPMGSSSGTKRGEGSSKQPETPDHGKKEAGTTKVEDMPSVFTIGDGPNGRKVEGILYRYGKGEEARIMCICHGSFFSPAEFVNHAGGRDVEHPLRHIVVNPSSLPIRDFKLRHT